MAFRSDLRTCLRSVLKQLAAGADDGWVVVSHGQGESFGVYTWPEWGALSNEERLAVDRVMLCMSRLELLVLLSGPVMGIFKELENGG